MSVSFFSSYLAGDEAAQAILPAQVRDREARIRVTRRAAGRAVSPALMAALRAQDQSLPPSAARAANLDALARAGTAVVATGQQVGLLLGPLYTFYKAASAISAARALEQESGVRCVPLFWLQTEDHDFAEIDHCFVPGAPPLRLQLRDPTPGRRMSVAHRRLGEEVVALLDQLERAFAELPATSSLESELSLPTATEVMALLRAHYRPGVSIANAFARVIAAVFAEEGLIVFDPRDPAVAALAAPLYRRSLTGHTEIARLLLAQGERLRAAGFEEQVRVRPESALLFHHHESIEGDRFRIDPPQIERLLPEIDLEPLRFSTSALLRTVVQDSLLPVAAYVGGPAEVTYFAQLPPLYAWLGLPMPLVVPRARFRCIEPATRRLLDKLRVTPEQACRSRNDLLALVAGQLGPPSAELAALRDTSLPELLQRFDALAAAAPAIDRGLVRAVGRSRRRVSHAIERLAARWTRALASRDQTTVERVDRLRAALFPDDQPQERVFSLPYFAARFGLQAFKQAVFAALTPFDATVRDFTP